MQFWLKKKMPKMISKKVYISRGGGVKANLEKVYILIFFFFYDGFPYLARYLIVYLCKFHVLGAHLNWSQEI